MTDQPRMIIAVTPLEVIAPQETIITINDTHKTLIDILESVADSLLAMLAQAEPEEIETEVITNEHAD